ncbi:YfcZ/YiiS family protein [Phocoenobacter skyensis]|uniref:YfcZ/YiiS family protein n=1 Tax=Phocoenobacter skyensis TaxID=97481 RepID=A0A1H7ZDJ1_9PAST|nr:YfcZ/YiiS family protein [Pasteurella skyensis]MDP8080199.1 YfcZ/YiiS family protein [Pasteurella skyensis]MDP8086179.1 YfcZ/YiiS family protein [Pasteurella skyensis]MDP8163162.1 YfcZ/YiiS family protein [Pasteurella skyensis]MDP8170133.1 YfcZ/YiiS family protein [Pasteurella skyensis]MDP8173363.1 YfcZ/YiiS family protein [Pasteurella skyensis]
MSEYQANESKVCCCVDVGTVIDGEDRTVDFYQTYQTKENAEEALAYLTEKARKAESDPCQITSNIQQTTEGYKLEVNFEFSCQAEAMIFQLSTR